MKARQTPQGDEGGLLRGRAPVVSVLIATYNQDQFIGQCLDSVLSQVRPFPIEIIVHDDASTDGTSEVVRSYVRRHPGLIRAVLQVENQFSRGRKAWPALHKIARGKYIAYCDGDDFWSNPHKLHLQVSFLSSHPEYVLAFHDAVNVDYAGRLLGANHLNAAARRDYSPSELRVLKWGWMLFGTMVHRNVGLEFPREYHLAPNGDHFMPILLATHGGAKFIEGAGPLAYRKHAGGIWSLRSDEQKRAMHLQTYLQISSYLVRTGDHQAASELFRGRLRYHIGKFLQAQNHFGELK